MGCGAIKVVTQNFTEVPIMTSSFLVDPRPLEPDWVTSNAPEDTAFWKITRHKWNKELRRYDGYTENYDGDSFAFLSLLAAIIRSTDYECEIEVDATHIRPREGERPLYFDLKYPDGYTCGIHWWVSHGVGTEESGTCTDELFDWVEYLINDNDRFRIELSELDPTP